MTYNSKVLPEICVRLPFHADRRVQFAVRQHFGVCEQLRDEGLLTDDEPKNVPGVPNGNWAFRVTQEQLDGIDKKWLKELNDVYYRSK